MMAMFRTGIVALALAAFGWASLVLYLRSLRRERLEEHWHLKAARGVLQPERDDYVRRGMQAYDRKLRRWTSAGIWVIPLIAIPAIIYWVNFR